MSLKNVFAVVERRTQVSTCRPLINSQPWNPYTTRTQNLLYIRHVHSSTGKAARLKPTSSLPQGTNKPSTSRWRWPDDTLRDFLRQVAKHSDDKGRWGVCSFFAQQSHLHKPSRLAVTEDEKNTLLQIILYLADTLEVGDSDVLIRLLSNLRAIWGVVYDVEAYTIIMSTLHGRDSKWSPQRNSAVFKLLRHMKADLGVTPTLDQWNTFLRTSLLRRKVAVIRTAPPYMRESGCIPDHETYHIFFSALFSGIEGIPRIQMLEVYLQDMQQDNVPLTRSLQDFIIQGYANNEAWKQVALVKRLFKTSTPETDQLEKEEQLVTEIREGRVSSARKMYFGFIRDGYKPSTATLDAIAKDLTSVSGLRRWEDLFSIKASPAAWTSIIQNALLAGRVRAALVAYQELISNGVTPTPPILHPILRALCSNKLQPPTENAIDKALELFHEYRGHAQSSLETPSSASDKRDLPLYNTLLRALTSSANVQKYFPAATSLLEQMRARGIAMDAMTSTSFVVLLIRTSPSPAEALNAYRMTRHDKDGRPVLDQKGYTAVLNAFCKECVSGPLETAPYMEIVKDMRMSGFQIPVEVYTILLRQLATVASRIQPGDHDQREALVAAIRRVHSYITVEASLTPDVYLWNQLMDTYQRIGCYGDAYKVWESIRVSGEFDNASVSIIQDACSFAGAFQDAVDIFSKLRQDGFALNKRNWDTFVETLCRLGRIEEALQIVCLEMPKDKCVNPDGKTVDVVLRFVSGTEREVDVRTRLKHFLPEIRPASRD